MSISFRRKSPAPAGHLKSGDTKLRDAKLQGVKAQASTRSKRIGSAAMVVSIAIHVLIFTALPNFSIEPRQTPLVLEFVEKAETSAPPRSRITKHKTSVLLALDMPAKKSSISGLMPSFIPTHGKIDTDVALSTGGSADAANGDRAPDDPNAEWGSGSADFSRVADLGRYDRLYELIDSHVMYPSVLASHGVQGTVNTRLVVQPNGRCDWANTKISSSQAHLRLYVLDILKSVCTQDLSRYARKDANSNFDLSFAFAITEHNEKALIDTQKKVVGNVFLFYRNSQQSIAQWHLGPFQGLFPIPYVAIDFAWLTENYERVINSRDPLHEFKDHLTNQDAI